VNDTEDLLVENPNHRMEENGESDFEEENGALDVVTTFVPPSP